MTSSEIINRLKVLGNPETVIAKQQKFGIVAPDSLGVYHKELNALLKEIPKDNTLALELFDSGIYEARILCSKLFNPKQLTEELMEKWVATFTTWELCDSFAMAQFARSKFAVTKINEWVHRTAEFEKRAAFATIAAYCMADKKAENEVYLPFLELITNAATDERLYVKKAVNWALRGIGKRNIDLKNEAIATAKNIVQVYPNHKTAQWIANNALAELQKDGVRISDYPRALYRK